MTGERYLGRQDKSGSQASDAVIDDSPRADVHAVQDSSKLWPTKSGAADEAVRDGISPTKGTVEQLARETRHVHRIIIAPAARSALASSTVGPLAPAVIRIMVADEGETPRLSG